MTGLDDFGKQTEEYLGEPWVGGIANVYVIIAAAIAFLIIGVAATRKP